MNGRAVYSVLGSNIDQTTWGEVVDQISSWAEQRSSRVVCICNVHSVVLARHDVEFQKVINRADLATPDGAPIARMVGHLARTRQERLNGPDLMWRFLDRAQQGGHSVFFYGGSRETLDMLVGRVRSAFPLVEVAGSYSPPYRELTQDEDDAVVEQINGSGASVVWVGLGCPKQERWMDAHRGRINAVMIGVGAAFDYHAGLLKRAPLWMQRRALEWAYRLASEPRRLWRRYLVTNSLFLIHVAGEVVRSFGSWRASR